MSSKFMADFLKKNSISDMNNEENTELFSQDSAFLLPEAEAKKEIAEAVEYTKNRTRELQKLLSEPVYLESRDALVLKLLEQIELSRQALRKVLSSISITPESSFETTPSLSEVIPETLPNIPLKLTLVPLCAVPIRGTYNIYFEVFDALRAAVLSGKVPLLDHTKRYTMVYNRVVSRPVLLKNGCSDNDNFEMKRVTNAITDAMGIADSVDKFSFFYTTTAGDCEKTEVYVVEEEKFLKMPR